MRLQIATSWIPLIFLMSYTKLIKLSYSWNPWPIGLPLLLNWCPTPCSALFTCGFGVVSWTFPMRICNVTQTILSRKKKTSPIIWHGGLCPSRLSLCVQPSSAGMEDSFWHFVLLGFCSLVGSFLLSCHHRLSQSKRGKKMMMKRFMNS